MRDIRHEMRGGVYIGEVRDGGSSACVDVPTLHAHITLQDAAWIRAVTIHAKGINDERGNSQCRGLSEVKSLYPLAHIHPTDLEYNKKAASIGALEEQIFVTASWAPHSHDNVESAAEAVENDQSGETRPPTETARDRSAPLLILAVELYLYTIHELGSAVLYVSKLDSSGYGPKTIPTPLREALSDHVFNDKTTKFGNTLTATLTSAVTQHFTSFRHWDSNAQASSSSTISHLSVHILARSQRAYLFPSSPENKDKKVLSDGALIKWWRGVMSDVVVATRDDTSPVRSIASNKGEAIDARAYYVVPGYNKLESHPLVPLVRDDAAGSSTGKPRTADQILRQANWTYGHPYSPDGANCSEADLPPLPLHWRTSSFALQSTKSEPKIQTDSSRSDYDPKRVRTVPTLMPHFSDDPKTRFLDEMARDAHEHSGWKKKTVTSTATNSNGNGSDVKAPAVTGEEKENGIESEVDISTFKGEEQRSQDTNTKKRAAEESSANDTAEKRAKADAASSAASTTATSGSGVPLITLRALMRERQAMDDLPIDEFWERMAFRQECCSGNAVGVLVILFTRHPPSNGEEDAATTMTMERQPLSLPYKVLGDLVFKSLMKDTCEWNKVTLARQLTEAWFQGVDREVKRKGGLAQFWKENEEQQPQEGLLVGKGTIWDDFVLKAPTEEQMEKVKKQVEEKKDAEGPAGVAGGGPSGGPTNMLSVKRKKKPAK
ncbi:hypothetical protein PHSY_006376 [Pseudozyma hubeiensis SY62]|uniref:histone acetyltransferase n=1 Tax=Pseudozyma hubeiensis (strain SY62) TaxID=1305764 RepID=R9PBN6_PSEHS|nr:hypothetical protein PHSY_006376 [Pseudozyma hubeiensis SY62]GAC98781.1 hypothetical protein PHSY_006376 [Pseudozyma hubeiensis SY62]